MNFHFRWQRIQPLLVGRAQWQWIIFCCETGKTSEYNTDSCWWFTFDVFRDIQCSNHKESNIYYAINFLVCDCCFAPDILIVRNRAKELRFRFFLLYYSQTLFTILLQQNQRSDTRLSRLQTHDLLYCDHTLVLSPAIFSSANIFRKCLPIQICRS